MAACSSAMASTAAGCPSPLAFSLSPARSDIISTCPRLPCILSTSSSSSSSPASHLLSSSRRSFCARLYPSIKRFSRRSQRSPGPLPVQASQVERSYVMVKPDGVQRGLVGEIISRFERKGFIIKGLKLFRCPVELAEEHYKDLKSKPFFGKLVKYITSGPVVCLALEGPGVVASARKLIGITNPLLAEPGTIRGDLGIEVGRNVIHGSDSPDNGDREIGLWFKEEELCEWEQTLLPWLQE